MGNLTYLRPLQVGETRNIGTVRVHRFEHAIRATECENAGKRGKTCEQVAVWWNGYGGENPKGEDLAEAISSCSSFAEIKTALEASGFDVERSTFKGVRVTPIGVEPIVIRGEKISVEATDQDFGISDLTDHFNEPRCIVGEYTTRKMIADFYRFCKDNTERIALMSMSDMHKAMDSIGVYGHHYCAMD